MPIGIGMGLAALGAGAAPAAGAGGSALLGPLAGAGIGAIGEAVSGNQRKKAAERAENRPKRRRLTKVLEARDKIKRDKEMALATLSQAVMDWASAIR